MILGELHSGVKENKCTCKVKLLLPINDHYTIKKKKKEMPSPVCGNFMLL